MRSVDGISQTLQQLRPSRQTTAAEEGTGDFAKTLANAVGDVRGALAGADETAAAALVGDAEPHQAMIALTKADLGFRFMTQVRNKAIDAYRQIMQMQM
jgi:flagellar hook-basal body complex protein FliE